MGGNQAYSLVMMDTEYIDRCESNYYMIVAMTSLTVFDIVTQYVHTECLRAVPLKHMRYPGKAL
jgi:hypothetical protein